MSLVREKEVAYVIVLTDSINNISYTRGVGAVSRSALAERNCWHARVFVHAVRDILRCNKMVSWTLMLRNAYTVDIVSLS